MCKLIFCSDDVDILKDTLTQWAQRDVKISVNFKFILWIDILSISCEIGLRWVPL